MSCTHTNMQFSHAGTPWSTPARAKKRKRKKKKPSMHRRIPMGTFDSSNRGVRWPTFGFLFRFLVEQAPHVRFKNVCACMYVAAR